MSNCVPTKVWWNVVFIFRMGGSDWWREGEGANICRHLPFDVALVFNFPVWLRSSSFCFVSFSYAQLMIHQSEKKNAEKSVTETFRLFSVLGPLCFSIFLRLFLLQFYLFSMISFICLTWLFGWGFNEYVNALVVLLVWQLTWKFPQPFSWTAAAAVTENVETQPVWNWSRLTMFDAHCTEQHSIIGYFGCFRCPSTLLSSGISLNMLSIDSIDKDKWMNEYDVKYNNLFGDGLKVNRRAKIKSLWFNSFLAIYII